MSYSTLQHVTYTLPNGQTILNDISFTLADEKTALIGHNGIGKSTLLKLILDELSPSSGTIITTAKMAYCAQDFSSFQEENIAQVLSVDKKIAALKNIQQGSTHAQDFEILNDDWQIEQRLQYYLKKFGLEQLDLQRKVLSLSGGEVTRLSLAKLFIQDPNFLILDEPTNNLDLDSRTMLYQAIQEWQKGLLIVSHDRSLLQLMDRIIEMTSLGVTIYGGNYDHYCHEKEIHQQALQTQFEQSKRQVKKILRSTQADREKHQQREKQGIKLRKAGSQAKVILDSAKQRSENTQSKLKKRHEKMTSTAQKKLADISSQIESTKLLKLDLSATLVHKQKVVFDIEDLNFNYEDSKNIISHFNFKLIGPNRIALLGGNGSGKTTLVKLMIGDLAAHSGQIKTGVTHLSYLDQNMTLLNHDLSVLDNFKKFNPTMTETDCRLILAQFLFRKDNVLKAVKILSGGEKLRALIACVLMAQIPPQLLILDEPTNHLDLDSLATLEYALKAYQGAMIVISHDRSFLKNIQIKQAIKAPFTGEAKLSEQFI